MRIVEQINSMIEKLENIKTEAIKFQDKGINSAATKVNKVMMEIKNDTKLVKSEISEARRIAKEQKAQKA